MIVVLAKSTASAVDTGPQCIGQVESVRVQVRLTGYSGDITVYQGESPTALTATKTTAGLASVTGSADYYELKPSEWIKVVTAPTGGTVEELLLAYTPSGCC